MVTLSSGGPPPPLSAAAAAAAALGGNIVSQGSLPASPLPSALSGANMQFSPPPTTHPPPLETEEETKKREERRKHIVTEIYTTEKTYVDSLETLVNKFFDPLVQMAPVFQLDANAISQIFGNIKVISTLCEWLT